MAKTDGDSLTDEKLIISQILSGNKDDFAVLVRLYHIAIRSYCFYMLQDKTLAEDAAQDIFRKAYENLGSFKGESTFKSWLYRIATNHNRDLLRQIRRKPTESWDALVEIHGERIEQLLATETTDSVTNDDREIISRILEQMPAEYREIILLKELDGLSYQEICQTLSCSLDAVKGRLKRARAMLDERLRHFYGTKEVSTSKRES